MKKNYLKIDHKNANLVMDKTFAKAAEYYGSAEYNMLQAARSDYPTYSVVTRTIKKNKNKESYRGLTYEYMENYIAAHANAKEVMEEYKELRLISECHSVRYAHVKVWFLDKYPEIKKFGVSMKGEMAESNTADNMIQLLADKEEKAS